MQDRHIKAAAVLAVSALIITKGVLDIRTTKKTEQEKRKVIASDAEVEYEAIERSVDIINERIGRGDIRNYDQLRDAVLTEVAFQTIAIHETN